MECKRIRIAHSTQCASRVVAIVLVVVNSVVFWPKNDKNRPVSSIFGAQKMCHFLCTSHFVWHFRAIFWNISILLVVVQFFAFGFAWLVAFESGSVPPSFISTSCAERVPISKQIRFACMRARFSSAQATHQNREKDDGKTPILTQKILTQDDFFSFGPHLMHALTRCAAGTMSWPMLSIRGSAC